MRNVTERQPLRLEQRGHEQRREIPHGRAGHSRVPPHIWDPPNGAVPKLTPKRRHQMVAERYFERSRSVGTSWFWSPTLPLIDPRSTKPARLTVWLMNSRSGRKAYHAATATRSADTETILLRDTIRVSLLRCA